MDEKEPGSLVNYAKAITFLQYLIRGRSNHSHNWIPKGAGGMHVLQANYDFLNQSITFAEPTVQTPMPSGRVSTGDSMIAHMNWVKFGLENVNGARGVLATAKEYRNMYDTCTLICEMPNASGSFTDKTCTRVGNKKVCSNCVHFGRPYCSWTRGIRPVNQTARSVEGLMVTKKATSALVNLPVMPTAQSALEGSNQIVREFGSSEQYYDDVSECDGEDAEAE
jgi:hypothetical protein